jgi:hypothetical protein
MAYPTHGPEYHERTDEDAVVVEILTYVQFGTADPSAGTAGPLGATYHRGNGGGGELWLKVGTPDTAWLRLGGATMAVAGHASAIAAAFDALVSSTSPGARHASATASAGQAKASVQVHAGHASATGSAGQPKPSVKVRAGVAIATGVARDVSDA